LAEKFGSNEQLDEEEILYLRKVMRDQKKPSDELLAEFVTTRESSGLSDLVPLRHLPPGSIREVVEALLE